MTLWREAWVLWCLLVVPVLGAAFIYAHRRRQRALVEFAEAALLPRLAPDVHNRRRFARDVLRLGALTACAVALAGPRWGFHWEEVRREGVDLVVALDISKSMLAVDVKPNRLERAKLSILDLLRLLDGDRVGLVAFAGTAFLQCPLTLDYDAFAQSFAAVDVNLIPRGGTAIERAIDAGIGAFEGRQGKHGALILITDGEDHEGDASAAAKRASDLGIKIFTIGIGTVEGELIPLGGRAGDQGFLKDRAGKVVKSRLDENTLRTIAEETGGEYVRASGSSLGLDELFRDHIATLERRELKSTIERRYEDRYQAPLAVALFLLAVEALIGDRRWAWRGFRPLRLGRWSSVLVLLLCALANIGWLGAERDRAREGNRLYDAGRYDEAGTAYGEGLVDYPESTRLRFNLGAAQYRQGNLTDAVATLGKLLPGVTGEEPVGPPPSKTPDLAAEAAYNVGNARYRLGQSMEEQDPQHAIALYEQALLAYKWAMALDPDDDAPKFNHEFVARHSKELKERLEEQQRQKEQEQKEQQEKQQEQEQQGEQEQQQPGEEKDQEKEGAQAPEPEREAQDGQETPEQQKKPEQPESGEEKAGSERKPQEQAQQDGGAQQDEDQEKGSEGSGQESAGAAGETGAEPTRDEMTTAEARTLIDAARGEEVDPAEIQRQVGIAGIGEPREDW